jgi:hypothetical protein
LTTSRIDNSECHNKNRKENTELIAFLHESNVPNDVVKTATTIQSSKTKEA